MSSILSFMKHCTAWNEKHLAALCPLKKGYSAKRVRIRSPPGRCAMLLQLSPELRGHVLMNLDPWTLWKTYLTSKNTVPQHVIETHETVLKKLQPELELPPNTHLGTILRKLVNHVVDPVLDLDSLHMEFPGFVDDVLTKVHILGRRRQHNISRPRLLRTLCFRGSARPTMTESSSGPYMAIGMDLISRFTAMYPHEQRAQKAAAIFRLGSYCYEVFHGVRAHDDIALLHFTVCGISGVICFTLVKSESSESTGSESDFDLETSQEDDST